MEQVVVGSRPRIEPDFWMSLECFLKNEMEVGGLCVEDDQRWWQGLQHPNR